MNWIPATKLIALLMKNCLYQGKVLDIENETIGPEAPHEHYKADNDSSDYWNKIIKYLLTLKLPADAEEAKLVKNHSKSFFICEKRIRRRNGNKPPLQVVLEPSRRMRLCTEVHNNSGHCGRDSTFKKLSDAFWWPNQYLFIKEYCRTCHECQMCSMYRNKIEIGPTYVRTILENSVQIQSTCPLGKVVINM